MDAATVALLFSQKWNISLKLAKRLAHALKVSPASRLRLLRHYLALTGYMNVEAFFRHVATPAYMMALCDDLVATGMLTRKEGTHLQDAILVQVRKDGTWSSYAENQPKKGLSNGTANEQKRCTSPGPGQSSQ